jgi:hypothetical protein
MKAKVVKSGSSSGPSLSLSARLESTMITLSILAEHCFHDECNGSVDNGSLSCVRASNGRLLGPSGLRGSGMISFRRAARTNLSPPRA